MPLIRPYDNLGSNQLWKSIGPHDRFDKLNISTNSIKRFQDLANFIFNTEKTGFVMEFDEKAYSRNPSVVRFDTRPGYSIIFSSLEDDYFHLGIDFPFTLSEDVKKDLPYVTDGNNGFVIQDRNFLVDSWDGLKEWAELFQLAKGDCDFWPILLNDLPKWELFQMDTNTSYGNVVYMKNKYPHIIHYNRVYYFKETGGGFVPVGASSNDKIYTPISPILKNESLRYLIDYRRYEVRNID